MTIQDIIDLTKAGYSKEDIAKLTQAETPAKTETGTFKPAPEQQQKTNPEIAAMQNQIDTLKQMMQLNNMLTVNQTGAPKERTIDDIFAEIINPPVKENKDK